MPTAARVFVIDDHPVFRLGLAALIRGEPGLELCGEAASVKDALVALDGLACDLVLIDLSLDDGSGLDLLKRLLARQPDTRALVVSMHDEQLYADRALRAGAVGYVSKDSDPDTLLAGIRRALAGDIVLSPAMTRTLLRRAVHGREAARERPLSAANALSDRELEVYELIGRGKTTREVARALSISVKTVETHQAHIKAKLGVRNANELVRSAVTWVAELGRGPR